MKDVPIRSRGWGFFCLLLSLSVLCFRDTPLFSIVPLVGYLSLSQGGMKGLLGSLVLCSALLIFSFFKQEDLLFSCLFASTLILSYILIYLDKMLQKEEREKYQEKVDAFDREFADLKKVCLNYQSKAAQLEIELKAQSMALEEKKEALKRLQAEYTALQSQLYADTELETTKENPEYLAEYQHALATLQQEHEKQADRLGELEHQLLLAENKNYLLEKEKEELLLDFSVQSMEQLSRECEELGATVSSLEDLVSSLVPFGKTRL
ncbi:MAG: hypothetical protein RLZZ453_411 [Chlamydiota bacterium]|jgi:DNA repair exonuclease SbcCD ATPase subunit